MSNDTLKLTDQEVLEYSREGLRKHLPLQAEGYVCTTDDLLNVLLGVAADRATIESVCTDLVGTPDPETIRSYLNEQLCVEDLPDLEQGLNAALAAEVPQRVWRQARDVAIDFHDRPCYGRTPQTEGLWVRSRAKDGTTRFYRIATAYVMLNGLRATLAIRFVLPGDDTVAVLDHLLSRVKTLGIRVGRLLLDKGFNGIAVMDYLTRCGQPALVACTIRGRTGGTRALCRGNKSYRTAYTFKGEHNRQFTVQLAVCRVFTTAKRTKRMKRRAQTTSNNPAYRFVLIALAFFLLNVWVHLRWLFTQVPRRGCRWLDTKQFELTRFAKFIMRALQQLYGCVHHIVAIAVPRP